MNAPAYRDGITVRVFKDRTEVWDSWTGEPIVLKPGETWKCSYELHRHAGRGEAEEGAA